MARSETNPALSAASQPSSPRPPRPSILSLLGVQVRHQLTVFLRTPVALFFTIVLPLMMLVVFSAIFSGQTLEMGGGDFPLTQFYVGGLAAFSAVSATFSNLANTLPIRREEGVLKRWRSTPLPPWVCIAGYLVSAVVLALVASGIMILVGLLFYDVRLDVDKIPALLVSFILGVSTFALAGIAVGSRISNAESAPAVANAIILPLAFISNVFVPIENPPPVLDLLSRVFPLEPFARSVQDVFNPFVDGPAFNWSRLAVVAAWGVVAAVFARRWFRWEPSSGVPNQQRRRRSPVPH